MSEKIKNAYLRVKMVEYLKSFIGIPYMWGGDDPMAGFDCSGLVVEALQAVGILKHREDLSAAGLYNKFINKAVARGYAGCLVFWFKDDKPIHVAVMADDFHVIDASGGDSRTKSLADAIKQNAFVKMRPLDYRGDNYVIVDPFKIEDEDH